jgi:hypothetical protein
LSTVEPQAINANKPSDEQQRLSVTSDSERERRDFTPLNLRGPHAAASHFMLFFRRELPAKDERRLANGP